MNVNQSEINNQYREILKTVFGNEITLSDKYLNPKAVIKHHCKKCGRTFFARPQWLVSGKDPHQCYSSASESPATQKKAKPKPKPKAKKATPQKATDTPKSKYAAGKVTEAMHNEMILLYKAGESLKGIARKFEVSPLTVKNHIKKAGVKLNT